MLTSVLYPTFRRHDGGEGVAGHTTTYCPGCGHGLVQRYLAEAVEALGVADRTVLVSPVGCAVFSYYYFDVGNTQAAHGRAPAVAVGHKTANPDAVVVSYQGDGDLAAIGLAEIVSTAQAGIPITVIFVNNAIYGMTGGQMAPTTLTGQRTTTTPAGRGPLAGAPIRMAELIAGLDGPVYVERVALYDNKRRARARRAIRDALALQVEGTGFAFVEVLAECPLHLGLDPDGAQRWVRDEMTPVFPLGVRKDLTAAPPRFPALPVPSYDPVRVLDAVGGVREPAERFAAGFPVHLDPDDVSIKIAGAGGDGVQTAALLLTHAAIDEGFDATHIPSYGPQSRGGTSYADVHVAAAEVLSPAAPRPHVLLAFNAPSLGRFGPTVRPGGTVLYDSSVVAEPPVGLAGRVRLVGVPVARAAHELGSAVVKSVVALGALQASTGILPPQTLRRALSALPGDTRAPAALNDAAFEAGLALVGEPTPAARH